MKQREIQKCAACDKGVMHAGSPIFYRVRLEQMAINVPAVERQHGLELVLGRNAPLAAIMGPNEDLAVPLGKAETLLLCQTCALEVHFAQLLDRCEQNETPEAA